MKLPSLPGFDAQAFDKYLKNTGWLLMARVGSLLIKMLVTAIAIPNYLGDAQNGILNYPLVLVAFFAAASSLGTDSLVTRELLVHPQRHRTILGSAFRMRLYAGLAIIPLIYLAYLFISYYAPEPPAAPFRYVAIVSFICIAQSVNIIDCYFQSIAKGKFIMYVHVGANLLSALLKLALILLGASLTAFVWMLLVDALLLAFGYIYAYRTQRHNPFHWKFDRAVAWNLLKRSWPLALSSVFVTLYMKIDQLMLDAFRGESVLGVYTTVVALSEGWYFFPMALVAALFPALMHARRDNPARYEKRLQQLYELMVLISAGIALIVTFIAPYIYQWLYNPEFRIGAPTLAIHIWAGVFVFLGTASGQYLIAENLTRISFLRTAVGAVANILLNLWLLPRYGMNGAAVATLIAYFISTYSVLFIPRTRAHGISLLKALVLWNTLSTLARKSTKK
ncbi:flippase [Parapedobacter sp. GCM10030251]|uniref:flippase n=1 Tax=Parapedobacter sp. GCM10030251 TaxID=3273419 RepID=UPI003614BC1B